jgi:hypothetical protein
MSKERFLTVLVPIKDSDCVETAYATEAALNTAVPPTLDNITNIYKIADGTYRRVWRNPSSGVVEYHEVSDREFPYIGNPLEIFDFTYDATRMGTAPSISAQGVMRYADSDGTTLDGLWSQQCHVVFDGKKLYLKQIPTSSKSNEDARYKYDMDFVDERVVLERVYLYDVVSPFITERPITESSSFSFYGDINELAKRINASLIRSGLASLTRKQVYYNGYPKIVPYLTYEQWTMFNVEPERLYQDGIFEGQDEMMAFYNIYNNECHGNYNLYLMGYIYENTNGVYDLSGYQCKIGKDKYGNQSTSEEKLITFENNTIHEALQQFHDTFELEYYITCEKDSSGNFTGNTWIMVADCEHDFADIDPLTGDFVRDDEGIPVSTHPFEYGDTEALLSKEKSNTTDKIVTRITGVGSTENIPWYYPNPNPDGWLRPFYTEYGVEIPNVTIDYPTDEGSSIADALLYEKFLKNRIGVPIKRGVVKEVLFKTDYDVALPAPDENYYILVFYYKINTNGIEIPRITLELDYNPSQSKCSRLTAALMRDGSTVALYDSSESYADPTQFQTMFDTKDGKHWSGLMSGKNYTLQVGYYIPKSEMPVSQIADYEGYYYQSSVIENPLQGYSYCFVGDNFYQLDNLSSFAEWSPLPPYPLLDGGYSKNGQSSGKVAPMPRTLNKQYKDVVSGVIYTCNTSNPDSLTINEDNAFTANPIMSGDEWLKSFVNMKIRVYDNDGWYINNKKVNLSDYGLSSPYQPGGYVALDIFNAIEFQRLKWVTPLPNLMPEVFIKTDGERRFYNAHNYYPLQAGTADTAVGEEQVGSDVRNPIYKKNETDTDDKHYNFESEYLQSKPHEHIENFDDVKPTIKEQTNTVSGSVIRIDVVETFDYDVTDNNEIWDNNEEDTIQGDYKHPYFFAKLRPMGFNIFDLATTDDMVLSMTTGNCGACNFKIGVDERTGKNPVQIWEYDVYSYDGTTYTKVYDVGTLRRYMNLVGLYYQIEGEYVPVSSNMLIDGGGQSNYLTNLYDRYTYSENDVKNGLVGGVKQEGKKHFEGDVVTSGKFIDSQQDTYENYVWVALMKDTESYGVIMPSAIPNYNDPAYNQYIEPKGIEYTNRANGEQSTLTEDQADKFVLTNIRLPQMYLRRAEHKLSRELVKYMYEHNWQRFNFSIKFSRIYIADNPATDDEMNENSVLYVTFNGTVYRQYAKHYSYRMSHDSPLPETNVDMNEDLSVSRTLLQQWDRKLGKGGHSALVHVNNVANRTRDLAQKHYLGKYDDLVNPSSSSQSSTTNIYNEELEWGEF